MPIDPMTALAGVKLITGALGLSKKQKDFERQQELNNLRTNIQIMNIEKNEQTLIESDINNKFRIQMNALKALGTSTVSTAFRGISGKTADQESQEILSNEAFALNKSNNDIQSILDQLANKEEQILFDQKLFDLNEPDLLTDVLNLGVSTATDVFLAGQQTGADKPFTLGG